MTDVANCSVESPIDVGRQLEPTSAMLISAVHAAILCVGMMETGGHHGYLLS